MTEPLVAVDAIAAVVADLKSQYTTRSVTASVGSNIRDPRPASFTRVRLMGGGEGVVASNPMMLFECWASSDTAAYALALLTEGLVNSIPDRLGICSDITHVGGPVDSPDPDSGSPRFVFTKVLHLRKHAI